MPLNRQNQKTINCRHSGKNNRICYSVAGVKLPKPSSRVFLGWQKKSWGSMTRANEKITH